MPADNKPNLFERLRGKRYGDIELESEGEVDPALKGTSTKEALAKAAKNFKDFQNSAVMRGIREAAEERKKK